MLRFAEEILLMALDDQTGKLHALPERALDLALAGAILMELAFQRRIDTDQTRLMLYDGTPTGDEHLDATLEKLKSKDGETTIQTALGMVAHDAARIRSATFHSLVEKGILREESCRFFFMFRERRYPVVDNAEEKEVKTRIREVVLTPDAIPEPRDVALICLMNACDLSHTVFTPEELKEVRPRIQQIAKMDFIGQALAKAISEIQDALLEVIAYSGM